MHAEQREKSLIRRMPTRTWLDSQRSCSTMARWKMPPTGARPSAMRTICFVSPMSATSSVDTSTCFGAKTVQLRTCITNGWCCHEQLFAAHQLSCDSCHQKLEFKVQGMQFQRHTHVDIPPECHAGPRQVSGSAQP